MARYNGNGSWEKLFYSVNAIIRTVGIPRTNGDNGLLKLPVSFARSGYFSNIIGNRSNESSYWSNHIASKANGASFVFSTITYMSAQHTSSGSKSAGRSLRCVAMSFYAFSRLIVIFSPSTLAISSYL